MNVILAHCKPGALRFLVGTRADNAVTVTSASGQQLANDIGAWFAMTSINSPLSIERVFFSAANTVIQRRSGVEEEDTAEVCKSDCVVM